MIHLDERLYCQTGGSDKVYRVTVVGDPLRYGRARVLSFYGRRTEGALYKGGGASEPLSTAMAQGRRIVRKKLSQGYVLERDFPLSSRRGWDPEAAGLTHSNQPQLPEAQVVPVPRAADYLLGFRRIS